MKDGEEDEVFGKRKNQNGSYTFNIARMDECDARRLSTDDLLMAESIASGVLLHLEGAGGNLPGEFLKVRLMMLENLEILDKEIGRRRKCN